MQAVLIQSYQDESNNRSKNDANEQLVDLQLISNKDEEEKEVPIEDNPWTSSKRATAIDVAASPDKQSTNGDDQFFDDLVEKYECCICSEIFHNPVLIAPCQHVTCAGCLSDWIKRE